MVQLQDIVGQSCSPLDPIPTGISEKLVPLDGIRAVLFDVYGTLFVSGSGDIGLAAEMASGTALAAAFRVATDIDIEPDNAEAAVKLMHAAIKSEHQRLRSNGVDYPEVDIREIWAEVCEMMERQDILAAVPSASQRNEIALRYEMAVNPVWPMPGAREVLEALNSRGYALGIVSNAQFFTPLLFPGLVGAGLEELGFRESLCTWSYRKRRGKPSADLYRAATERLAEHGFAPEKAVIIGNDMLNDITPPSALGWRTILFAGDRRSLRLREDDPRCTGRQPDAIISQLPQLLEILPPRG